jgi:cobalamin biosynthesis protein CobT
MTTYQESFLESTFQKIARIIARRYGVTVSICGGRAYVDMKTMNIVLPSVANGERLEITHLDGFLDHECAHVKFTDVAVFEKTKGNLTLHGLWNGCEDVWIERAMGDEFFGCHQNLERLNVWLYEKCEERWPTMDPLGRLHYSLERCYRGDFEKEKYEDDPLIGGIIVQLQDEIDRGKVCHTSNEAISIAESIYEKIKQLADNQDPSSGGGQGVRGERSEDNESDSGDSSSGDGDSSDGDDGNDDDSKSSPGTGDDEGESEGSEGVSQSGDERSGDDADGSSEGKHGQGEQSGRDAESKAKGKRECDSDASEKKRKAQLKKGQEQAKEFMKQEGSPRGFDKPLDVEGLVNEMLTEFYDWSTKNDPDQYVVFSEEYDYDTLFDAKERKALGDEYNKIRDEVKRYVGNLSNILEMTLHAEAENRWVGGARRGKKFDQRRLAHWAEGADDDRLFRYMEEGIRHDTAITLLWDCSGSMGSSSSPGDKAALARIAAVAFHEALRRCTSITHEVLGFNTDGEHSSELSNLAEAASANGDDLARYSRIDQRDARMVFVPFGGDDGRPIAAITGGAANRDGECVLWAARRLAKRSERRKILIVGSDGHPQGARYHSTERKYLRDVVKQVMSAGLEVYGLGIMDDAVKTYYPNFQVIQDAQDLPRAVMTLLASSLPAQNRGRFNERLARL